MHGFAQPRLASLAEPERAYAWTRQAKHRDASPTGPRCAMPRKDSRRLDMTRTATPASPHLATTRQN